MLYRARTLIGLLLVILASSTGSFIWSMSVSLPVLAVITVIVLLGTAIGVLIWVLLSLRHSANLNRGAHITVANAFLCIELAVLVTGGPPSSPIMSLLVVPPVIAFALAGLRIGLIWTGISALTQVSLFVIGLFVSYPDLTVPSQLGIVRAAVAMMSFFDILGIVMVYEVINARLQQERDRQHENYAYLATHDTLTGLANRSKFMQRLTLALSRIERNGKMVALVYLDLDGFKAVNDTFGHEAGDSVLRVVSQRLTAAVRSIDTIARLGGDEFAVLLEDIENAQQAEKITQRLLQSIRKPIADYPGTPIGGSFGIAVAPAHTRDADTLTHMADTAMYQSKKKKNTIVMYGSGSVPRADPRAGESV